MSVAEAAAGAAVEVEGVVTFRNAAPFGRYGFLQDGGEGVYAELPADAPLPPVGSRIRAHATTQPGDFAPSLRVHAYERLPAGALPEPVDVSVDELMTGRYDSRLVRVEGTVLEIVGDDPPTRLVVMHLMTGLQRIRLELPMPIPRERLDAMLGALVRVEGVCGTVFNAQRQLVGVRVLAASLDHVALLRPGVRDLATLPITPIGALLRFEPGGRDDRLVRVRGVVTLVRDGWAAVEDASGGLLADLRDDQQVAEGQHLDLIGYAAPAALSPRLEAAWVAASSATDVAGIRPAAPTDLYDQQLDHRLARTSGVLVQQLAQADNVTLSLDVGGQQLTALLPGPPIDADPGATLEVTGVLRLLTSPAGPAFDDTDSQAASPRAAQLLLRSAADVRVVSSAPFWSTQRAWGAAVGLLALLLVVACWLRLLSQQVRRQTRVIRGQLDTQGLLREQAEAASEAKSAFLANMSHEIRTPLHGVMGATSALMHRDDVNVPQRELLRLVAQSAEHLRRLVDDVLDLSRAESGQMELERRPTEVRAFARLAVAQIRQTAEDKGLWVQWSVADDVPAWVEVDPTRLQQVALNLLTNAVKFTERGAVALSVTARDPGTLQVAVIDTGIGIPPEQIARLFERFKQADESITRRFGGTGLGLAICQELVERMGGRIDVTSELGVGSTFVATIDAPSVEAPAPAAVRSGEALSAESSWCVSGSAAVAEGHNARRVLVAEDNPVNQTIVRAMLESLGCEATLVTDGIQAVDAVRDGEFDLILMDLHMPVMSGHEAVRRILELKGDAAPPIVALTADALTETAQACLDAGMAGVLTKPMPRQVLAEWLESSCGVGLAV